MHPVFHVRRKTFVLYLGNWFVEEATRGYGICPGGPIPLVNVPDQDQDQDSPHDGVLVRGVSVEEDANNKAENEDLSTYEKFQRIGMPEGSIRHRSECAPYPCTVFLVHAAADRGASRRKLLYPTHTPLPRICNHILNICVFPRVLLRLWLCLWLWSVTPSHGLADPVAVATKTYGQRICVRLGCAFQQTL